MNHPATSFQPFDYCQTTATIESNFHEPLDRSHLIVYRSFYGKGLAIPKSRQIHLADRSRGFQVDAGLFLMEGYR